jgi:prepilin-type N-terminal cleavage/methylation domain-containing protein
MIWNSIEPTVPRGSIIAEPSSGPCHPSRRGGFTLVELLVVILIILLVSAVALPTIIPAVSHRQVSEAGRILQGALVGARDAAIRNNAPTGIRLLPDPTFSGIDPSTGRLNANLALAANRIIPIQPGPVYSEGLVNVFIPPAINPLNPFNSNAPLTYPVLNPDGSTGLYPYPGLPATGFTTGNVLMIQESLFDPNTGFPNPPTSWFWNIRIGDQIQINNSGPWYAVVGPMYVTPTGRIINGLFYSNPEMFVNVGPPGSASPLVFPPGTKFTPEFLFLVNGQDDNNNGWTDEGWDGVNNNGNVDVNGNPLIDELLEWENETWQGSVVTQGVSNQHYTILRRPAPGSNAREVSLPTNVVIDMTTWNNASPERSRLPVNPYTGYVDILVYPNGTVVPSTIYSSASSFPMAATFLHFWLAERSDVYAPTSNTVSTSSPPGLPYLPLPKGLYPTLFNGTELKGEYRLLTLFARTGQITTDETMAFDPNAPPPPTNAVSDIANGTYNPNYPFLEAQQGARGGP